MLLGEQGWREPARSRPCWKHPGGETVQVHSKLRITLAIGDVWRTNIACCSNHVRNGLSEHLRVQESLLHTIYNGIDLHQFHYAASPRSLNEPIRVGMVARLEPHKDQPTLMRAAALLRSRGIHIRVDLVGDGSRRAEYEELSKRLDIDKQIRFLGVRRDIPDLLRSGMSLFTRSTQTKALV